jgi:hypothetical protein
VDVTLKADGVASVGTPPLSMTCPACGRDGTFEAIGGNDFRFVSQGMSAGHRRCPNSECLVHVFVVHDDNHRVVTSYPPQVIDFDTTNVPSKVVAALEEAIKCHANGCYVAAAVMVRKALEELCEDRKAKGANLKKRIAALGTKIVLPQDLLDGLDDLRLLGNDAAHIESSVYDEVGREEVEIAIEVTKEVLKGVYQMSALVKRLRGLQVDQAETS